MEKSIVIRLREVLDARLRSLIHMNTKHIMKHVPIRDHKLCRGRKFGELR